jgi:hypothetical protein
MPGKNNQRLNDKQAKLIRYLRQGLTISEAGRRAGYGRPQTAHRAFKAIRLRFHPALQRAGIDAEQILIDTILTQYSKLTATETKFFDNKGIVIEEREVLAHDVNLTAARDLQRFLGAIATTDLDDDTGGSGPEKVTVNMVVADAEDAKEIMGFLAKMSPGRGHPVLDAELNQDPGRSGPDESL